MITKQRTIKAAPNTEDFETYLLPVGCDEYESMTFTDDPELIRMPIPNKSDTTGWDSEEFSLEEYLSRDLSNSVLDLTSKNKKLLVRIYTSWFHFLREQLPVILYEVEKNPDIEVIIVTSGKFEYLNPGSPGCILIEILGSLGISHRVVRKFSYRSLKINNFILSGNLPTLDLLHKSYEFYKKYLIDETEKPHRKVFLSRKKVRIHTNVKLFGKIMDTRIDNHDGLENFFRDLGFEIIYAEDILDFKERVNFFHGVEILASLSGSGLTNAVFMQEGTAMLEIATPLVVYTNKKGDENGLAQEHHPIYITLAKTKNILYFSIFNLSRNFEELKKLFLSSNTLRKILDTEGQKND